MAFNKNMGFNRRNNDRRGGGRRSFGGGRDRNRGGDREMHSAVCDKCGKNCKVPFKPSSGKPVLCSDCFEKKGGSSSRSGGRNFGNSSRGGNDKKVLERINALEAKLDKVLSLLNNSDTQSDIDEPETKDKKPKETEKSATKKKSAKKVEKEESKPKKATKKKADTSTETPETTSESVEVEMPEETPEETTE